MLVGVPKEIKTHEYRVGLVPGSVRELARHGHKVLIETNAGAGIGFGDAAYEAAGARVVADAAAVFAEAEMVVKVKEPLAGEYAFFRKDLLLYTYLHLAAEPELTKQLAQKNVAGVAYETIQLVDGSLP